MDLSTTIQIPAATNSPLLNYNLKYGKSCISSYKLIVCTPYIIQECHVLVRTVIICFGKVIPSTWLSIYITSC